MGADGHVRSSCGGVGFEGALYAAGLLVGRLKSSRTLVNRIAASEHPHEHALDTPGRVAAANSMDVAMGADGDVRSSCGAEGLTAPCTHLACSWGG